MSAELTQKIKDHEATIAVLKDTAAKRETAEAGLSLKLKEAESKVTEKDAEIAALKDQVAKRDEADAKRVEAEQKARVDEAFDTFKDKKNLTDADKRSMTITLKSDPALFEELYPKVAPDKRHLLRQIASQTRDKAPPVAGEIEGTQMGLRELSHRIAQQKGIPLAEAQRIALSIVNKRKVG